MTLDAETLYTLYLDESGVYRPGIKDAYEYFVFGGILVRKPDEQPLVDELRNLKSKWAIAQEVPLHACEIRSKNNNFAFLGQLDDSKVIEFKTDILSMVLNSKALLHGCAVHRRKYLDRFEAIYGRNTWELLRSATVITVERAAKYVYEKGGRLFVVFERGNASANNQIRQAYRSLLQSGAPFNATTSGKYSPMKPAELQAVLFKKIEDKTKANEMLQIADSCLLPLVEHKKSGNFTTINKLRSSQRLLDCHVADPILHGIKYYCFDP